MNGMQLVKEKVRSIKDFPIEGVIFRDITTAIKDKDALKEMIDTDVEKNGEIELTDALELTQKRCGMIGYAVKGKSFDVGLPEKYLETMMSYAE